MEADLRALANILSRYKQKKEERKEERKKNLVTLNLLGGRPIRVGSRNLDLDFPVSPFGLENHCDLLSGKMHPQQPNIAPPCRELQDLNLPLGPDATGNNGDAPLLEDSTSLDLKLMTPATSKNPNICTLENVKSALERAEHKSRDKAHRVGRMDRSPSSLLSSVAMNSSMKRRRCEEGREEGLDGSDSSGGSLMAAGCPYCLLYVLVAKWDPCCPRCGLLVPTPAFYKKLKV